MVLDHFGCKYKKSKKDRILEAKQRFCSCMKFLKTLHRVPGQMGKSKLHSKLLMVRFHHKWGNLVMVLTRVMCW